MLDVDNLPLKDVREACARNVVDGLVEMRRKTAIVSRERQRKEGDVPLQNTSTNSLIWWMRRRLNWKMIRWWKK